MTLSEKKLFKQLCSFRSEAFDEKLLQYATPEVLGHLFFNRMQAVAYGTLKNNNALGMVNREIRSSLRTAYEQNCEKNISFLRGVSYVAYLLKHINCNAVMLKGAVICGLYPDGYRTANDIDLLIMPQDITYLGNILTANGFIQGSVRNDTFIPASRKEIIESKMTRGETIPYIKEINLPHMKYLEVDINFSLDYKNSDTLAVEAMLDRMTYRECNGIRIPTLCSEDFFIHLCVHLYKEASTLPWINMKRDMTLYKYADIYMLLSDMSEAELLNIISRAKELELDKCCAYAILQTIELFEMNIPHAYNEVVKILQDDMDFLSRVIAPKENKYYIYENKNVFERLFMPDRSNNLKEEI